MPLEQSHDQKMELNVTIDQSRLDSLQSEFDSIKYSINSARGWDINFNELREMLVKLRRLHDAGDYLRALEFSEDAQDSANSHIIDFRAISISYAILSSRELISKLKDYDIDVSKAFLLLTDAKDSLDIKKFSEADGKLRELRGVLTELQNKLVKNTLEMISQTRHNLEEAKRIDAEVGKPQQLLKDASIYYDAKKYLRAAEMIQTARTLIDEAKENRIQEINELLNGVEGVIAEAKRFGCDIGEAEELYEEANAAFDKEDFFHSSKLTKKANDIARKLFKHHVAKAMELLKEEPKEETRPPEVMTTNKRQIERSIPAKGGELMTEEKHGKRGEKYRFMPQAKVVLESKDNTKTSQTQELSRKKTMIKCPNCAQIFEVEHAGSLTDIQCPYCGLKGSV